MVYSTCHRELGDAVLAEDATQIVFLVLARKAPTLMLSQSLAGWLFVTARFTTIDLRRRETRRQQRETPLDTADPSSLRYEDFAWSFIDPNINDAISALGAVDRDAVLLRFYEECSYREIGAHLSLSEAAAERRVARALVKMRRRLIEAGFTASISALAALLMERAARAVPQHCASAVLKIASGSSHAFPALLGIGAASVIRGMTNSTRILRLKIATVMALSTLTIPAILYIPHVRPRVNSAPIAVAAMPQAPLSMPALPSISTVFTPPVKHRAAASPPRPKSTPATSSSTRLATATPEASAAPRSRPASLSTPIVTVARQTPADLPSTPPSIAVPSTSPPVDLASQRASTPIVYTVVPIPDDDPASLAAEYRREGVAGDVDRPVAVNDNGEILFRCGDVYRWDGTSLAFEHRTNGMARVINSAPAPKSALEHAYEQVRATGGKITVKQGGQVVSETDVAPQDAGANDDQTISTVEYEPEVAIDIDNAGDVLGIGPSGVFVRPVDGDAYVAMRTSTTAYVSNTVHGRLFDDGRVAANIRPNTGSPSVEMSFAVEQPRQGDLASFLNTEGGVNLFTQSGTAGEPIASGAAFRFQGMNDAGVAIGLMSGGDYGAGTPVFVAGGRVSRLPALAQLAGGKYVPCGIDGAGDIVGYGAGSGLLWQHGKAFDLNDLVRSGYHITRAVAIDDNGDIVGEGMRDGESCAILLIPATGSARSDEASN